MSHARNEKCEKHIVERIERSNQERIRRLEDKENYQYLRILKVDIIKHEDIKENIRKKSFDEVETFGN